MTNRPTILVPLQVLEGESIPKGIPSLLAGARVLLLGYHVIPEQTATEQAREQFAERATERLEEFEGMFEEAGAEVESRMVFTHEAQKTKDRIINEVGCTAVLIPKATPPVEDVLVPVRGTVGRERLLQVLVGLFAERDVSITLFHVMGADESEGSVTDLFEGLKGKLVDAGFDRSQIGTQVVPGENTLAAIEAAADGSNVVVMGESDPTVATYVFGLPEEQLAEQFLGPVVVIQRPRPEETEPAGPGE